MKKIIVLILLITLIPTKSIAQFNVSFLTNSSNTFVGVGYGFNEKISTDLRIFSTTAVSSLTIQALLRYDFVRKEDYAVYVAAGLMLNDLNAALLPVGVEFKPIKNNQKFSIFIEFQPFYEFDFSEFFVAGYGGLRYRFK